MGVFVPLSFGEREIISRELVKENSTTRSIAAVLGREHSSVAREIRVNGGRVNYRAVAAQQRCEQQRSRVRARKLEVHTGLCAYVN